MNTSQAASHDRLDGERGNVYADPLSFQSFRGDHRGSASAEGVENEISFPGGRLDDPFKEDGGFLCGITEAFRRPCLKRVDVGPPIGHGGAAVQVPFPVVYADTAALLHKRCRCLGIRHILSLEMDVTVLAVAQNHVVLSCECGFWYSTASVTPDDFVQEILCAEHAVHYDLQVMGC